MRKRTFLYFIVIMNTSIFFACNAGLTNTTNNSLSESITVPILCAVNEHVLEHVCEPCAPRMRNEAGDNTSDENTFCEEGFVLIPSGSFVMGSPNNELERDNDEGPQHEVTITRSFYMQRHEVTQGEWEVLMENNPSYFSFSGDGFECGSDCPVEQVNWFDALRYANALSTEHNLVPCFTINNTNVMINADTIYDCEGYRLPTEAEWEYAIRAGTTTSFYNEEETSDDIAWHRSNSNDRIYPVGQKEANLWGLNDMSGNVYEWCWDPYGSYDSLASNDPVSINFDSRRILRGGSWYGSASGTRSANRSYEEPDSRFRSIGFRLVISAL